MDVIDKDLGLIEIVTDIKSLGGKTIKIGIQDDENAKYENGVSVVDVANWNEYGTPKAKYPIEERPFIRQTFALHKEEAQKRMEKALDSVINGADIDNELRKIGEWYQNKMKETLQTFPWEGNKKSTIARKKSSKPLIDTGQLRNSIRYKVE